MHSSQDRIPLKAFFEMVESRLKSLSAGELRGVLLEMARRSGPNERARFLELLQPPAQSGVPLEQEAGMDGLLQDIVDLEKSLREEMKDAADDYEEYDGYDDESGTAYEDFTGNLEELFDRAQAVFDLGQYLIARDAYGGLFDILRKEDDYGRTVTPPDGVDLEDAGARYLHALCVTAASQERPAVLLDALRDWEHREGWWGSPKVGEIFQVGSFSKPEREAILSGLVDLLSDSNDLAGDRWLREATRLLHGREGIGRLARLQGHRRPHAYLDWLEEVAAEDNPGELAEAAREALGALPAALPLRAAAADHLYRAAVALGDEKTALEARWEAFQTEPGVARLLDLWDAAGEGDARRDWARRAATYAAGWEISRKPIDEDSSILAEKGYSYVLESHVTRACSLLLAEKWDEALEAAAQDPVLGWSGSENTQALVLPFMLLHLTPLPPASLPPNLRTLWQEAIERQLRWGDDASEARRRLSETLTAVMRAANTSPADDARHLEWCVTVALKRVNAIADGTHRSAYDRAATLAVALAEMLRARGDQLRGDRVLDDLMKRHNRKPAFKGALQACRRKSHC
jgi:hypothetical protein